MYLTSVEYPEVFNENLNLQQFLENKNITVG